jgi:hypothetical protein
MHRPDRSRILQRPPYFIPPFRRQRRLGERTLRSVAPAHQNHQRADFIHLRDAHQSDYVERITGQRLLETLAGQIALPFAFAVVVKCEETTPTKL